MTKELVIVRPCEGSPHAWEVLVCGQHLITANCEGAHEIGRCCTRAIEIILPVCVELVTEARLEQQAAEDALQAIIDRVVRLWRGPSSTIGCSATPRSCKRA